MRLIEAAFEIPKMLADIGAREGRMVSIAGVHSIRQTEDGEASVYLDLLPRDANSYCGTPGTLIIYIDARDCVDAETILETINEGGGTLH
jgi:hypothetical protein